MTYPRQFLSRSNFILAFERIVRGGNKEYKQFYRHLYPPYNLSLQENLDDLIHDIKSGTYKPSKPTIVFQPKKTADKKREVKKQLHRPRIFRGERVRK